MYRNWLKKYYKGNRGGTYPSCITCNICSQNFEGRNREYNFVRHLRLVHEITFTFATELDNHPRANILNEKYEIKAKRGLRKCKWCNNEISFDRDVSVLENHLEECPSDPSRYVKKYFLYLLKRAKIELVLFDSF